MSDFQNLRQKFENSEIREAKGDHVVINVRRDGEGSEGHRESRRISLSTLEWLSGKVDALRRKFSAASIEQTDKDAIKKRLMRKVVHNGTRRISESDGDLVEMCKKYQICGANKYTWIVESFETIVMEYGELMQANHIEIHRGALEEENEPPRGLLLLPLSSATGQALLDFSEMGGYSLGRGSRVAKLATRALSRTHCMIYLENNCVYVKDCDSKTGTFVNGKLLGSSSPTALENFDIIQMGYGRNVEDYIQSMVIFLDNWNPKEFASFVQQLNSPTRYSRTFSNSVSDLKSAVIESEQQRQPQQQQQKRSGNNSVTTSPLVSSPKLTEITGQSIYSKLPTKSSAVVEEDSDTDGEETIVFERPQPMVKETKSRIIEEPTMTAIERPLLEIPKRREYQQVEESDLTPLPKDRSPQNQKQNSSQPEAEVQPYKVHYHNEVSPREAAKFMSPRIETNSESRQVAEVTSSPRKAESASASSRIESSFVQATPSRSVLEDAPLSLSSSPRPPKPRPRRIQKGLSKSAECLVEVELEEIVEEVEQRKRQTTPNSQKTIARMPIESALAARRTSVTTPAVNVAIPDFLKSENLKIPTSSPAQDLLHSAKFMFGNARKRKFNLPMNKKRKERLDKFRNEAQFTTIVQGAETRRFENFVDFGSATSDISDGLAESQINKKETIKTTFNNFRMTWMMESLNKNSGNKLMIQSVDGARNKYVLAVEGKVEGSNLRIGFVETDFKTKNYMKISFKIDDDIFKGITGTEIDTRNSLPIKALDQLTYFYPHLEVPSVVIQGPIDSPSDKVTINLVTSKQVEKVGRIVFEGQKVSWSKRQMFYAVDLDTVKVEMDSLLCDAIQSAALLYCLRYHID